MIGCLPVYFTATGNLRGGYIDQQTGETREGGPAAILPAVAGLIVMASALAGALK